MHRNFDPSRPCDVRQFIRELARLTATGPVGAAQAERWILELSRTSQGKQLLQNARLSAKVDAEAFGIGFNNVKVHTDSNADNFAKTIGARAFVSGTEIFFQSTDTGSKSSGAAELIAHELTHVVQQTEKAGKK